MTGLQQGVTTFAAGGWLPLAILLTSLVAAPVIFALPEDKRALRTVVNLAAALLKLVLVAVLGWQVAQGARFEFRMALVPGIDLVLQADPLSLLFVTLSSGLWLLTTIYAIGYLEGAPNRSRFFGFFSLCVSATIGVGMAGNLLTFVIFYELLTLATYPLVVHRETDKARRAGRIYLAYTLGGGILVFAGAAWLWALAGTLDFVPGGMMRDLSGEHGATLTVIFVLLIAGLGVKAALVPLHGWLPIAMVAPAPVSALLHAVAVVKAGAFGIVRVVHEIYGVDVAWKLGLAQPLAALAGATIIYGSVRALFQEDLKRRLAYSTVSQVSYVVLGATLLGPAGAIGGLMHLIHQGVMKITLFMCGGNLAETLGIHRISDMDGIGRRMPWTMAAFTVAALGMIGAPPLIGFASKWYLGLGGLESGQAWVVPVLLASSALNAAYFLPILHAAWFRPQSIEWQEAGPRGRLETRWTLIVPPVITALVVIAAGVFANAPFSPLSWARFVAGSGFPTLTGDGLSFDFTAAEWLLFLVPAVPLLFSAAIASATTRRWLPAMAVVAPCPAVLLLAFGGSSAQVELPWVLLGAKLGLDATGRVILALAATLWLCAAAFAVGYMAKNTRKPAFFFWLLLAMAGNLTLPLAQDALSFYAAFALMSFASYGLVVHDRSAEAMRAGRVYMVLAIVGELSLFAGTLLVVYAGGPLLPAISGVAAPPLALALLGVGFAVKAGLVPMHVWLPLAHPAAPIPASAVLSGIVIKAGLLGALRFAPIGINLPAGGADALIWLGVASAMFGVAVGLMQSNAKAVLAYSSISQMGLIAIGVGVTLGAGDRAPSAAWALVLMYAVHHGLAKAALFLGVAFAPLALPRRQGRLVAVGLLVPAAALAAAPFTGGAVAKGALKLGAGGGLLPVFLSISSLATTLLMARLMTLLWPGDGSAKGKAPLALVLPWVLLVALCALWPLAWPAASDALAYSLEPAQLWEATWPILLGIAVWTGASALARAKRWRPVTVPAGDVLSLAPASPGLGDLGARIAALMPRPTLPEPRLLWIDAVERSGQRWIVLALPTMALTILLAWLAMPAR